MKMKALIACMLVLVLLVVVETRKPWKIRGLRKRNCQYVKGNWSDCDPVTNSVTRELKLTNGEPECTAVFNQSISCQRYERIQDWREKKIDRKRERQDKRQQTREEKLKRKQERKEIKHQLKRCKYTKSEWSECDQTTNTTSKILTLQQGHEGCKQTHTITISCKRLNRIEEVRAKKIERKQQKKEANDRRRQEWQERKQQRKEEKQRLREEKKKQRQQRKELRLKCKYDKGEWSPCNDATQTVTRVLTLRDGDEGCEQTFDISIACARYERIQAWRAQKMEMKEERKEKKERRKEELNQLKANGMIMRGQKRLGCDFEVTFSDCDPVENTVTKTYTQVETADGTCESRSFSYSCDLHKVMMEKKKRRQKKRMGRKFERKQNRKEFFRQN